MSEFNALAAAMLAIVALRDTASDTRWYGNLCARITRHGADYALELNDVQPIHQDVLDAWAVAVAQPAIAWDTAYGGKFARCAWRGAGEDLPAQPITWINQVG